ncbi:MAG: PIN domain-containing protein [Deltaproteobacteria bacterium]|nr:PIN domain-containing protein [Deltaproteobacteria bacterium]
MKDNRVFIDTNIFIYTILTENQAREKRDKAISLLQSLSDKVVFINTQVLNEIYSVMLRHEIEEKDIQEKLEVIIRETRLSIIRLKTVKRCWELRMKYKYSYWDCLIMASALENQCAILYTEDMQHQQQIEQSLRIINPFG